MTRNITLRISEALLKRCRSVAAKQDKSLSQWVTGLMKGAVAGNDGLDQARQRAMQRLESGFKLGGRALSRSQLHER
jgi:hypothetical protein